MSTAAYTLLGFALFVALVFPVFAQPALEINYQGKLTDSSGLAVADGLYDMEFALYTVASGGSAVWTETRTGGNQVQVTNGLFSVMLGEVATLSGVNFNQTLYLGVNIESDGEMTPRKLLGSVPSAFQAQELGGVASSSFLRSDQADEISAAEASPLLTVTQNGTGDILNLFDGATEVFSVLDGGNVGIGTSTPSSLLTVAGTAAITGTSTLSTTTIANLAVNADIADAIPFRVKANSAAADSVIAEFITSGDRTMQILQPTGSADPFTFSTNNAFAFRVDAVDVLSFDETFNVSIGNADESIDSTQYSASAVYLSIGELLNRRAHVALSYGGDLADGDVTGGIQFGGSNETSGHGIKADILNYVEGSTAGQEGGAIVFRTKADGASALNERLRINESGNVGIGTTTISEKLTVDGNISVSGTAQFGSTSTINIDPANFQIKVGSPASNKRGIIMGSNEFFIFSDTLTGDSPFASNIINNFNGNTALLMRRLSTGTGNFIDGEDNTGSLQFRIDNDGNFLSNGTGDNYFMGDLGIGTTTPSQTLTVAGNTYITGALFDSTNASGTSGMVLQTTGAGTQWVATSSLGIGSNIAADSLDFTDFTDTMTIDANTTVDTFTNGYIEFDGGTAQARFGGTITLTDAGFTLDGTNGLSLLNGVVEVPNGSAGTPTFTFESDTNTGLFRAGADILGFSTAGTERLRIDSSGNVGIGVTNPDQMLTVAGSINASTTNNVLLYQTTSPIIYSNSGAGNFGVTDSAFSSLTTGFNNSAFGAAALEAVTEGFDNTGLGFFAGGALTTGDENTVIGSSALSLAESANRNTVIGAYAGDTVTTGSNNLLLGYDVGDSLTTGSNNIILGYDVDVTSTTTSNILNIGNLLFGTGIDGTGTTTSSGNIGIGTAAPTARLEVVGDIVSKGTEWTARPAAGDDDIWEDITYGNGLFVAVGGFSTSDVLMTSPDGINWATTTAAGDNDQWKGVTYGNGLFVAVGTSGDRVMTSPDGITWTARSAAGDNDSWQDVTYGNGLFVAVSDNNDRVMTSPDGITWTVRSAVGDNDFWKSITHGNGLFVAVGTTGDYVMTSPDGITWTARSAAGDDDEWQDVTYGNGLFVAVSAYSMSNDKVMTSPDGITWTARSAAGDNDNWQGVVYGNGLFVAVGEAGLNDDYVMTSPDGITWTARSAAGDNDEWEAIAYGNGRFVAVGASFSSGVDHVMTSGQPETSSFAHNNLRQGGFAQFGNAQFGTTTLGVVGTDAQLSVQTNGTADILNLFETSGSEVFTILESGNVGIGTTTPSSLLTVAGDTYISGALRDSTDSAGTSGMVLQTTGSGTQWVATSSLGIGGGGDFFADGSVPMTDTLLLAQGALGTGGISFNGDTNTGIFRTFSDGITIQNGGTNVLSTTPTSFQVLNQLAVGTTFVSADTQFRVGNPSTATTTAFSVDGLDTGMFSDTADTLALSTGGVERLRIDASGNVGIGTSNPLSLFTVSTGTTAARHDSVALRIEDTTISGADTYIGPNTTDERFYLINELGNLNSWDTYIGQNGGDTGAGFANVHFVAGTYQTDVADNTRLTIQGNTGNVGIGTTTPSQTLTVAGNAYITGALYDSSNSAGTNGMVLQTTGTGTQWVATSTLGGLSAADIDTSAELAAILTDETGAAGSLVFSAGPTFTGTATFNNVRATTYRGLADTETRLFGDTDVNIDIDDDNDGTNTFNVRDGADTPLLTVLESGNVGIGTTSPNAKLTVAGDINFDDPSSGLSFMGTRYLYASSTNDSIAIGEGAGATFTADTTNNVAIGFEAGRNASTSAADFNVYLGWQSGYDSTGFSNNFFGGSAGRNNTGSNNIAVGSSAGGNNTGSDNVTVGNFSGRDNTADDGIFLGTSAGRENTAQYLTAIGRSAGYENTGADNNLIGRSVGYFNTGSNVNALGVAAAVNNTGSFNNFFGNSAGYENTGSYNEFIGYQTGRYLQATSTVAIGGQALFGSHATNFVALNNVALGYRAGYAADDGANNNILIGYQAADSLTTGANNIVIGYDVEAPSNTASNQLNIGNLIFGTGIDGTGTTLSTGNIGIGTTSPTRTLSIAGDIFATGAFYDSTESAGTGGMILQTTGSGTQWVATSSLGLGGGGSGDFQSDGSVPMSDTLLLAQGALGTGGLSFNGDTDTGMFRLSADTLGFSTGGTERLTINSTGDIGVGTTSPYATMSIVNNGSTGKTLLHVSATGNNLSGDGSDIFLEAGGSNNVASTGGDITLIAGSNSAAASAGGAINITGGGASNGPGGDVAINGGDGLGTNDGDVFLANLQGNVGIGTTTISEKLTVDGNINVSGTAQFGSTISIDPASYQIKVGSPASNKRGIIMGSSEFFIFSDTLTGDLPNATNIINNFNGYTGLLLRRQFTGTGNFIDGESNTGALQFRIDSDGNFLSNGTGDNYFTGNLGIGTTTPAESLSVIGNITATGTIALGAGSASAPAVTFNDDSNTGMFRSGADALGFSTGGTERLTINSTGDIGIGTTTPNQTLQVIGDIRVGTTGTNGCIEDFSGTALAGTCSSDRELKTDILTIKEQNSDSFMERFAELDVVTYKWNQTASDLYSRNTEIDNLGVIAQDVQELFPELISYDDEGYRQVDFRAFPFYIIEALKEVWEVVTGNQEKIETLEDRIEALEAQLGTEPASQGNSGGSGGGSSNGSGGSSQEPQTDEPEDDSETTTSTNDTSSDETATSTDDGTGTSEDPETTISEEESTGGTEPEPEPESEPTPEPVTEEPEPEPEPVSTEPEPEPETSPDEGV